MLYIFNFIKTNNHDLNFYLGSDQNVNFNFTDGDYSASSNFEFSTILIFSILKGDTNNFSSIWVSNDKLYVSTSGILNTVDLSTNTLYDWYSQNHTGRANEKLNNNEIIDVIVT